ncbi:MAG: hypothetical protein K2X69_13375 [Silvanigrellaceae bacterium]|nr:hypothetical protein [Silvanigrellaceae bacterium]
MSKAEEVGIEIVKTFITNKMVTQGIKEGTNVVKESVGEAIGEAIKKSASTAMNKVAETGFKKGLGSLAERAVGVGVGNLVYDTAKACCSFESFLKILFRYYFSCVLCLRLGE